MPQLARPQKHMWQQPQRGNGRWLANEAIDGAQQFADLGWLGHGGEMGFNVRI